MRNPNRDHLPRQMLYLWNKSCDPIGVKDLNSRIIYVNTAYLELNALPKNYDFEGRFDDEIPTPLAAVADKLREHDKRVMKEQEKTAALEIHRFGRAKIHNAFICEKMPLYSECGAVAGTIFHARLAQNISTDIFSDSGISTGSIMLYPPSKIFTPREWEIIFLYLRRYSRKEIARALFITDGTVRNRLEAIYEKIDISSCNQLRDYIRSNDWHNFVPERFAVQGHRYLG